MTRIASFGMYDGPALHDANDALWALIAEGLAARGVRGLSATLDRGRALDEIWRDPDLLLAQCCGYPLATRYRGTLRYVTTPLYAAPGCEGTSYRSRIVVRAGDDAARLADLRGRRAAINERTSNSGMNMFRSAIAPLAAGAAFFAAVIETGSHAASLRAIVADDADVAAIDTVSFAHLAAQSPELVARVRTIGWTAASPGLPFVTAATATDAEVRRLREVIDESLRDPRARLPRDALLLDGVERLPARAYDRLLRIEAAAARLGYPELS